MSELNDLNDSITQRLQARKAEKNAGKLMKERNRVAEEVKRKIEYIWVQEEQEEGEREDKEEHEEGEGEEEEEGEEDEEDEDEYEDDNDNDNTEELKFEAPEDLSQLEEIKKLKSLVARFGPPGRYFDKKALTDKADDTAEAVKPFGNYRRQGKSAAAWTAQDALYTCLHEFARAGGRVNDEGIGLIREDPYYSLWREVALLIINEYRSRVKRSLKEGKHPSQAEFGLVRRIKNKAKNAMIGWYNNGRVEIRGQSYPADSDAVLPSRAQVLATRFLDKLGAVNGTLFGDLISLGRPDLGLVKLPKDQTVRGVAVVAESPGANAEIKKIQGEIIVIKDKAKQEFRMQREECGIVKRMAKEAQEAAKDARNYVETEIAKTKADIKAKDDNLNKKLKANFAQGDKDIDRLKEENLKLKEDVAKLQKTVDEIRDSIKEKSSEKTMQPPPPKPKQTKPLPAKTLKRPREGDESPPTPKMAKQFKPLPGKAKTTGDATGKATKRDPTPTSKLPEEEKRKPFDW